MAVMINIIGETSCPMAYSDASCLVVQKSGGFFSPMITQIAFFAPLPSTLILSFSGNWIMSIGQSIMHMGKDY